MAYAIAVAGKGGTGKTTLCGLLIDALCKEGRGPVLAVDADANSNLNEVMGVDAPITLGSLREDIKNAGASDSVPASMTKQDYLGAKFAEALIEEPDYDMLVMGRTQGTGCYCFVNSLLKTQLERLSKNYKYIVVDNEAGMEHLSRGVLPSVNLILIVSDCSLRGVQAAGRIRFLVDELGMKPDASRFIINRAPEGGPGESVLREAEHFGLDLAGVVPHDPMIYDFDREGRPTVDLPRDSPARSALFEIFAKVLPHGKR
ncbi:MAG: AAA family ATPase [Clostridiales Family XIII bacterium]|jgi:CO dehydrogenase maturation factor|nr:AAA family ATPase [Clostridiales Family XIII bacterium]